MPIFYTRYWDEICVATQPGEKQELPVFQRMHASRLISNSLLLGWRKRNLGIKSQLKRSLVSKFIFVEKQNSLITSLVVCALLLKERKPKRPKRADEERDSQWWQNGYRQWTAFALVSESFRGKFLPKLDLETRLNLNS